LGELKITGKLTIKKITIGVIIHITPTTPNKAVLKVRFAARVSFCSRSIARNRLTEEFNEVVKIPMYDVITLINGIIPKTATPRWWIKKGVSQSVAIACTKINARFEEIFSVNLLRAPVRLNTGCVLTFTSSG
jgi:hypothetical protein